MDDVMRHPDDATLFDLVEGSLEPARTQLVQQHLSRCAACAAFVQAARIGGEATSDSVEAMPADAAEALHRAVAGAWRERVATIAATEAAEDAVADTTELAGVASGGEFAGFAPGELQPPTMATEEPARARAPRRRGRRLVPVLAFIVLGTLAGTSLYIGDAQRAGDRSAQSVTEADSAGGAFAEREEATSADLSSQPDVDAPTASTATDAAGEAAKAERSSGDVDAAAGAAVPPTPGDYDEYVEQERVCIATLDAAGMQLPEGRIPSMITRGPFGFYVVCG